MKFSVSVAEDKITMESRKLDKQNPTPRKIKKAASIPQDKAFVPH